MTSLQFSGSLRGQGAVLSPATAMRGYTIKMSLALLVSAGAWAQTPFDVVPGGVKPDSYAVKDFEAYVSFRFAGESDWWTSHRVTIKKGEGLTADGRRAKCGNQVALKLPPGAKTLPPGLRFVEPLALVPPQAPDLIFPTPESFYFPPAPLPPISSKNPPAQQAPPFWAGGIWLPPGGIPLRCKDKTQHSKECESKPPKPPPALTPEVPSAAFVATGLIFPLIVFASLIRRKRASGRANHN